MLNTEEHALAIADRFYSAALGIHSWDEALSAFAAATGSRSGELITLGPGATVPVNIMTNVDPGLHAAFIACRGGDPAVNPRVGAGMKAPVLQVLAENDFMTADEHKRHPHYTEFARPWGIPYICLTTLERTNGLLVGLAVCRSEREGHITARERRVFTALAPHVRAAVRMQMAVADQSARLVAGMFESLTMAVFVCDGLGHVRALSEPAEALIRSSGALRIRGGMLTANNDVDSAALSRAINVAASGASIKERVPRPVIIAGHERSTPLVLDVVRLPIAEANVLAPSQILILVRNGAPTGSTHRTALLQTLYKMTAAETEVALQVAQGHSAEAIAANRSVAVGTVRAQIKCILAKMGLKRQVELVARIAQL